VSGALQDPFLEIHNADGSIVASNDSWKTAGNAAAIQATGAAPTDDREAAILITLSANTSGYTAVVRGANNTTGVALVEVFDLN
jgi:FlaG/FlaF family flagellin (archaellin)